MVELLERIIIMLVALASPTIDEVNYEMAQRLGVEQFDVTDDLGQVTTHECTDTPMRLQPYNCKLRMRWALLALTNRENAGNWSPGRRFTGIHRGDASYEEGLQRAQIRSGRFSKWCPFHRTARGKSTVGPAGMMYAYNVQRVGTWANCMPWWLFASNTISGTTAARLYVSHCSEVDQREPGARGWCPTLRAAIRTRNKAKHLNYHVETRRG